MKFVPFLGCCSTQASIFPLQNFLLKSVKLFSSKPRWNSNSNSNLIITHPVLLLIESCNSMSQLKQIHANMTCTGLICDLFPVSRLLSFCVLDENGHFDYAILLFSQIPQPNVYIWNTMIRGSSKARHPEMGLGYFRQMIRAGVEMDRRSYVFVLKSFGVLAGSIVGSSVHGRIWKMGFLGDSIVSNALICWYSGSGRMSEANQVFDDCPNKDVVSWTSLIDGYVKNNLADEALELFSLMNSSAIEPNEVTMIAVFSACSQLRNLNLGKFMHDLVFKRGMQCGLNLTNAILDMYAKCDCLEIAEEIFDAMKEKDVFSWTTMINAYAKHGKLDLARKYFDEMPTRNVVSWSALIAGYSQNNQTKEALELFHTMTREGISPIESTLVSVLSACSQSGFLAIGERIHKDYIAQKGFRFSVKIFNAIIDMYCKCGIIGAAAHIFEEMPEKDLVSWNSMIVGFASHGQAEKALSLFEQMKCAQIKPDAVTFVGVLSACAHGGLVSKGWKYFRNMKEYGLTQGLEHYACMIDLLGRIGLLEEAYDLIATMPMKPDQAVWGALLNGCRMHANVELGKLAAYNLIALDPQDSGIYVLLSGLCAKKRKWDDVRMVRSLMREKNVKKNPGCSLIEMEGAFHEFLSADESHPQSKDIYRVLDELILNSKLEVDASDGSPIDFS